MSVIEAIAWGIGLGIVSVVLAGVRRLPWLYAEFRGRGYGGCLRSPSPGHPGRFIRSGAPRPDWGFRRVSRDLRS